LPIGRLPPHCGRLPAVLALCLTVAGASPATAVASEGAPGSRQEQWEQLRRQKLLELHPDRPSYIERKVLEVEKGERPRLFDLNFKGFYPRAQSIGWGSQVALGVRFWQPDIGRSRFDVHASAFYSLRSYESYELQAGFLPHRGRALPPRPTRPDDAFDFGNVLHRGQRKLLGYTSLRYHHLPEVDFYGLGNDSSAADHTTFLQQDAWYDLVLAYAYTERAVLLVRGGWIQAFVGPGHDEDFPTTQEVFDPVSAPGLDEQPDFQHVTAVAVVDGRDEPGNPHAGGLFAFSAGRFNDRQRDAYDFHRLTADARAFLPLGSHQRVLALRAMASVDKPAAGSQVPFYLQETLGGAHTLRGFSNFRFRGERILLLQAEYRWEAAPAVELAAFVDAGNVFSHESEWTLDDLHTSYGLGLRFKTQAAVLLRFDVARSPEDTRFLVRFGHPF
jgi:hypothetical protein